MTSSSVAAAGACSVAKEAAADRARSGLRAANRNGFRPNANAFLTDSSAFRLDFKSVRAFFVPAGGNSRRLRMPFELESVTTGPFGYTYEFT